MDVEVEQEAQRFYAARVPVVAWHGESEVVEDRFVVVEAESSDAARHTSALIDAEFHEATDAELDAWDGLTSAALDADELGRLHRLVRRELRDLANKAARRAAFPKPNDERYAPADRYASVRMVELLGKLELLMEPEQ